MRWDDEWDEFTQTVALTIDNDRNQYEEVLKVAGSILDTADLNMKNHGADTPEQANRIALGLQLKCKFGTTLVDYIRPTSKTFSFALAGALLNEVVGHVNWNGLAQHYLGYAQERRARTPAKPK